MSICVASIGLLSTLGFGGCNENSRPIPADWEQRWIDNSIITGLDKGEFIFEKCFASMELYKHYSAYADFLDQNPEGSLEDFKNSGFFYSNAFDVELSLASGARVAAEVNRRHAIKECSRKSERNALKPQTEEAWQEFREMYPVSIEEISND